MLIDLFQKTRTTSMQMKDSDTLPEEKPQIVCKGCGAQLQARNYGRNLYVRPSCGRYARLLARTRVRITADKDSFREMFANIRPCNPLDFEGYREKIEALQEKTGMQDAVVTGVCTIGGIETCLGIMDSHFLMASMGSVVGEKLTRLFEYATRRRLPVILFTASGGARMQEGMFSLADGEGIWCGTQTFRCRAVVYHCANRSYNRRCHSKLCLAWRYHFGRAPCNHWVCRPPRH